MLGVLEVSLEQGAYSFSPSGEKAGMMGLREPRANNSFMVSTKHVGC